jgi:hypothetical protein
MVALRAHEETGRGQVVDSVTCSPTRSGVDKAELERLRRDGVV